MRKRESPLNETQWDCHKPPQVKFLVRKKRVHILVRTLKSHGSETCQTTRGSHVNSELDSRNFEDAATWHFRRVIVTILKFTDAH